MYKVYLIRDIHGLNYVGCTKQTLKRRLQKHESDKRTGTNKSSSHKLDLTCCKISILEDDITEENKREREQYWIDKIECVNVNNAIYDLQKRQNYFLEHKEDKKEYDKKYRNIKRNYEKSWGEPINNMYRDTPNNLLLIDTTLFLNS